MAQYRLLYTALQLMYTLEFLNSSVAPLFNIENSYKIADTIIHDGLLYACIKNSSAGNWDPSDWEQVKLFDNNGYFIIDGGQPE